MIKINPVTIFGGFLILSGLFGPWFKFNWVDTNRDRYLSHDISPFTFTTEVSWANDPTHSNIFSSRNHFYGANTTFLGIVCILGAIVSFLGGIMGRERLNLMGGGFALFSTISFPMCLPGYLPGMHVGWGIAMSTLGAILIIFSSYIKVMLSFIIKFTHNYLFKESITYQFIQVFIY